jgi:hypothetical protein
VAVEKENGVESENSLKPLLPFLIHLGYFWLPLYLSMPLEGHVDAVFCVCAYLAHHQSGILVFDDTYPAVDMCAFIKTDWNSMYWEVKEVLHSDASTPQGKEVDLHLSVESDHAGEQLIRRSSA